MSKAVKATIFLKAFSIDKKVRYEMSINNANDILKKVNEYITKMENSKIRRFRIDAIYSDLSIFDWFNEYLSKTQLLDMRKFLNEAIKLGYTGYVCFKVGAVGCANGMWAHKNESTTGYSPDGECLYKSFVSDSNYWCVRASDSNWYPSGDDDYNSITTISALEKLVADLESNVTIRLISTLQKQYSILQKANEAEWDASAFEYAYKKQTQMVEYATGKTVQIKNGIIRLA